MIVGGSNGRVCALTDCRLGDMSKSNFAATSKLREPHSVDLLTTNRYWLWSVVPAISIYGGRGNRWLDFLTGNSFESINFESWHWHCGITPGCGVVGEEGGNESHDWMKPPPGCLQTLSLEGTGSLVIRNMCWDVGQLHVLLKQINT